MTGIEIFKTKKPCIYEAFKKIIDSRPGSKPFFKYLTNLYEAIETKNSDTFNRYYSKLINLKISHRHPFYTFLTKYLPLNVLIPPYLNALEQALANQKITYDNRNNKIKALTTKNMFWGTFCELILADILVKQGCSVRILGDDNKKHPDLEVKCGKDRFLIEVSSRIYKVNKQAIQKKLIDRLKCEGKQLPKSGINNIIVLLFDYGLKFGQTVSPQEMFNCFNTISAMYDSKSKGKIVYKSKNIIKEKKKLILETHNELYHISGVGFIFSWQAPLEFLGYQTNMFLFVCKDSLSKPIKEQLLQIKLK